MKVSEILTRHPSCIAAGATIEQAARQMKILDVGMLPVCDNKQLVVGSVTDRDIVIRGVAQLMNLASTPVGQIMTSEIVCCFEDQDTAEAARLMEHHQVRRLPVLDRQNRLVGILSISDLLLRDRHDNLAGEVLERVSTPPSLIEP